MKNIFFTFLFLCTTLIFSQNVVEIHYRHVPSQYIAEFEAKEMDHWSKVKQNAIDNGDLLATAFFRVADAGFIEDETLPTHASVLVYKDFDQLAASNKIWSSAEKVL